MSISTHRVTSPHQSRPHLRARCCHLLLAALPLLWGCGTSTTVSQTTSPDPATTTTPIEDDLAATVDSSPTTAVPQFASLEEVQQRIEQLGRPAVVDFWSLACQPCMDEFPGLVALHKQQGDRVACIAVDIDFDGRKSKPPETYQQPVTEFLAEVQATFTNYICTTPSDDVYAQLKIPSIPTVFVFASDGSIAKKFVDAGDTVGFSYEKDVVPFVTELLDQPAP